MSGEPDAWTGGPLTAAPLSPTGAETRAERFYLPQLDGLRFIAFLLVYWFHGGLPEVTRAIQSIATWVGVTLLGRKAGELRGFGAAMADNGWVGVQLFFILSGYLIATLLLREEKRFGRVDLPAFWMRRILRIWPLYYWVLLLGFFVLPFLQGGFGSEPHVRQTARQLPWFALFLGNWSMGFLGPVGSDALSILWSVCVEEQFYLVCPLLLAWVAPRLRVPIVLALIGASIAGRHAMAARGVGPLLFSYGTVTHVDSLLGGVLLALLLDRTGGIVAEPRQSLRAKLTSWMIWPIVAANIALLTRPKLARQTVEMMTWDYVWIWMLGAALIAHLVTVPSALRTWLSKPRIVWLGRVSYGLYMYHEIALWLGREVFARIEWFPFKETVANIATLALCIAMAKISYERLEQPFLRRKAAWSRVSSRPV